MKLSFVSVLVVALAVAGCNPPAGTSDQQGTVSQDGESAAIQDGPAPGSAGVETVAVPADPFFTENAYPGATPKNSVAMGNIVSVWFLTDDDMEKVIAFYQPKFAGGQNNVDETAAYFSRRDESGVHYGATVTRQMKGTQIILKIER